MVSLIAGGGIHHYLASRFCGRGRTCRSPNDLGITDWLESPS
jgi:hypothetical protein